MQVGSDGGGVALLTVETAHTEVRRVSRADEARELRAHFPGLVCWWGKSTHRWWAIVPSDRGGRLVEGEDLNDFVRTLKRALGR